MNTLRISLVSAFALGIASLASPLCLHAKDYTLSLTANQTWTGAPWSPTGVPGANDRVLNFSNGGTQTYDFYLDGDQALLSFTSTNTGISQRIYNGTSLSNVADGSLNVSEEIAIRSGSLYLRSRDANYRLSISASSLQIGGGTAPAGIIFGGSDSYRNVSFTVSGATVLTGNNPLLEMQSGLTASDSKINLGHVIFKSDITGSTPGILFNSGALTVKSLRSSVTGGGTLRTGSAGKGTLLISGAAGDPGQPEGENIFYQEIRGGLNVEKTGTNTQIFAAANTYTDGTVISGGVLSLRNTTGSGLGSGNVVVKEGGTLAGSGILMLAAGNSIKIQESGIVAPGADGAGFSTLSINGNLNRDDLQPFTMEAGAKFSFNLDESGRSDSILFGYYSAGYLKLDPGGMVVDVSGTLSDTVIYTFFTFKSDGPKTGSKLTSSGLTGGLVAGSGFDGFIPTFHYDDPAFGGLGTITMTVSQIPEPHAIALAVPIIIFFSLLQRRSRRQSQLEQSGTKAQSA